MEHWNGTEKGILFEDLQDTLLKEMGKWEDDWEATVHFDKRRQIKDLIEKRLAVIFPDFKGLDFERIWRHSEYRIDKRGLIAGVYEASDQNIFSEFNSQIQKMKDQCRADISKILLLFCYVVHLYTDSCSIPQEKKDEQIRDITKFLEDANPMDWNSKTLELSKIWTRYSQDPMIKNMKQRLFASGDIFNLDETAIYVLNESSRGVIELILCNTELSTFRQNVKKFMDDCIYGLKKMSENFYNERINELIFTKDTVNCRLSDSEEEFIRLLLEIIPANDRTILNALKKDQWDRIPAEDRKRFIACLTTLSRNLVAMNRYIGVIDRYSCHAQVENVIEKMRTPQLARMRTKLQQVNVLLERDSISTEDIESIEKHLDKILGIAPMGDPLRPSEKDYERLWYLEPKGSKAIFKSEYKIMWANRKR
jgi:hypothetical protein